ncbi:tetratricopeptide repeat protein [Actinospica sp. MGRD01-02]|uniref:Tetratricopeptide repeat protein n=1 Tax=Actinospica acidithermotolerans TaxID=2828514 RepID=A0A941ILT8_9ACTN|nr:tetratricopeptide repeat protein [Actinospica acidithermotolerans]
MTGHPGIGKTAFAVRLAHAVASACPDGSLFSRVGRATVLPGSTEDEQPEYVQALISALREAHAVDPGGHASLGELTQGKRLLFLIDDVSDESDLEPLLDVSPGCIVIVTSRSRLARLAWTHEVELGPLTDTEAVDLLTVMLGADGVDQVAESSGAPEEVVRAAGRFPLAVRMAGIALANGPFASLSSALERINEFQPRPAVEPSDGLDVGYALLADEERTAIDVIGTLDGQILAPWTLAALLDATARASTYDDESAQRILDALVRVRFLERFSTDGASVPLFRVHDLIMVYARRRAERLGPDHVAACQRSLELSRLARSDLGLERSVVHDALDAMGSGDFDRALRLARESVALGRENRNPAVETIGLVTLAEIQIELGGTRQAKELVQAAGRVEIEGPSPQALRCIGKIDRRLRKLDQAAAELREAVQCAKAVHDDHETVHALRELAVVYSEADRPDQAREATAQATEIARSLGDAGDRLLAGVLWALGRIHRRAGDFTKALDALLDADVVAQQTGARLWQAWIRYETGRTRLAQGAADQALTDGAAALRLFTGMRHEYGAAYCETLLGEAMIDSSQEPTEAARILEHALTTYQRCGDPWIEAETARIAAAVRIIQGRHAEAARLLETAAAAFDDVGDHGRAEAVRRQHLANPWARRGGVRALLGRRRGVLTELRQPAGR